MGAEADTATGILSPGCGCVTGRTGTPPGPPGTSMGSPDPVCKVLINFHKLGIRCKSSNWFFINVLACSR